MTDLDLDALAAVAEAATQTQWAEEWFRCHADDYFKSAMAGCPDLVDYFADVKPETVLALIAEAREARRLRGEVAALAALADAGEFDEIEERWVRAADLRALIGGGR